LRLPPDERQDVWQPQACPCPSTRLGEAPSRSRRGEAWGWSRVWKVWQSQTQLGDGYLCSFRDGTQSVGYAGFCIPIFGLRREWQPQALPLSIHPSLRLVSAKRQAVAGGARLGDGLVCGKCGSLKRSLGMVTYAVFRMAPSASDVVRVAA
jgi:hypothetical protein